MSPLQFSLFFAALLVAYILVHVRMVRFEKYLREIGGIKMLNERLNALSAGLERLRLDRVEEGTAYLRLEGGCQGCAMAEVTLRQGVEVMIKERVPEIVGVLDVTDHGAGTEPYFKTRKGPARSVSRINK